MELDDYMIDYHPYRGGTNPEHRPGSDSQTLSFLKQRILYDPTRKNEFEADVCTWIEEDILSGVKAPVVIAIAPGHSQDSTGEGNLLYSILGQFIARDNIIDGRTLLHRTGKVPKSTEGGPGARDQTRHEETIEVSVPEKMKDKEVFIFDDVWTSGATLRACKEVAIAAGAASVKLFAVGKTA
uniref:Phosphoribosyltransferase domain-containing protein n=1 Tax=Amphimedon queenslandica TaxID=400682 RepID=A0A1X7UYQ1_AMPQE